MQGNRLRYLGAIMFLFSLLIFSSVTFFIARADGITIIEPQEHWKYNVEWTWDPSLQKTVGIITPKIIIQNETANKIDGYIADVNGTRLTMYGPEQIVQVKFISKDGFSSDWITAGRTHDGFFSIDIPEQYKDSQSISIYIGSNSYYVNLNRLSAPLVLINSARLDYERHPLETAPSTSVAAITGLPRPSDSFIDRILQMFGLSPI